MTETGVLSAVRRRALFLWRSLMTGVDELGGWTNHNRVVGWVIILAILGVTIWPLPVPPTYRIPIAIVILALVTLNGAYTETAKHETANLADDAMIASFSDKTRMFLLSPLTSELVSGDLNTSQVEKSVIAELQEHGLVNLVYVPPGPRGLAHHAVPHLNLTPNGSRILREMRQGQE